MPRPFSLKSVDRNALSSKEPQRLDAAGSSLAELTMKASSEEA
jgi:hypothetical protein